MINMLNNGEIEPDDKVVFDDGFLYIITKSGKNEQSINIKEIILAPEYDNPISLTDISSTYPNVRKVIFEEEFRGFVYDYKNGSNGWELVGTTIGYA